jgi:hypothetical protein
MQLKSSSGIAAASNEIGNRRKYSLGIGLKREPGCLPWRKNPIASKAQKIEFAVLFPCMVG